MFSLIKDNIDHIISIMDTTLEKMGEEDRFNDSITRSYVQGYLEGKLEDLASEMKTTLRVVCDETINTPNLIDQNGVAVVCFFKYNHSPDIDRVGRVMYADKLFDNI